MTRLAAVIHRWLPLAAALYLSGSGVQASALEVQVEPAWNGLARQGSTTEVKLTVKSPQQGQVRVDLRAQLAAIPSHQLTLDVMAAQPGTVHLVIPQVSNKPLLLELRQNNAGSVQQDLQLEAVAGNRELIAIVGSIGPTTSSHDHKLTYVAPAALPSQADAYQAISALVIDSATLTALDPDQLSALQQHIVQCGAVIIRDAGEQLLQQITANAGCNGQFVAGAATENELWDGIAKILAQPEPTLIGLSELRALAGSTNAKNLLHTAALIALYLIVLLIGFKAKLPRPYLLAIPPGLSLIVLTLGTLSSNQVQWVSWSETYANEPVVQQMTLLTLVAANKESWNLPLAANERDLVPITTDGATADYRFEQHQSDDSAVLSFSTQLLDHYQFAFADSPTVQHQLHWSMHNGKPIAKNVSTQTTPQALLAWRGDKHVVPALAPQENWQPSADDAGDWENSPEEQLLRARALRNDALVLEHNPIFANSTPSRLLSLGKGQAYLLRSL